MSASNFLALHRICFFLPHSPLESQLSISFTLFSYLSKHYSQSQLTNHISAHLPLPLQHTPNFYFTTFYFMYPLLSSIRSSLSLSFFLFSFFLFMLLFCGLSRLSRPLYLRRFWCCLVIYFDKYTPVTTTRTVVDTAEIHSDFGLSRPGTNIVFT